jgi:hypothetical protein
MNLNEIKDFNEQLEQRTRVEYRFARIVLGILVALTCAFFMFACNSSDHYNRVAIQDLKTKQYSDLSVHVMHKVGDTVTYNYRWINKYEFHDRAVIVKIYNEDE